MTVKTDADKLMRAIEDYFLDLQGYSQDRARKSGEPVSYTDEMVQRDVHTWQNDAKQMLRSIVQHVESAIKGIPNWAGSDVTLVPHVSGKDVINFDSDDPKLATTLYAHVHNGGSHRNAPSFAIFEQDGKVMGIDDTLDAGDSDFFHDPVVEADYFSLAEEMKHSGRARAQANKVIKLFTARPMRDRHVYEDANQFPVNVFLTTSESEAWGYTRDIGGGPRDIYRVLIKRQYLVETLASGSLRNYQTFAPNSRTVPVESCDLIAEADTKTARSYDYRGSSLPWPYDDDP